jgi:hypothetical protein
MAFDPIDWGALFGFDAPILELVIRGTVMYFLVLLFLRLTGRRAMGELSLLDFLFVLLIAVGTQNAVLGDQSSIGSGVVLVLTLVAWNFLSTTWCTGSLQSSGTSRRHRSRSSRTATSCRATCAAS